MIFGVCSLAVVVFVFDCCGGVCGLLVILCYC